MNKTFFVVIFTCLLALFPVSNLAAQNDSLKLESNITESGRGGAFNIYSVNSEEVGGFEVPIISSSPDLIFDSATLNGSIAPLGYEIGWHLKDSPRSILIFIFPPLNATEFISGPGGKICEVYYHIDSGALSQTITLDTAIFDMYSDTIFIASYALTAWDTDGYTAIPFAFQNGIVTVTMPVNVEEEELEGALPEGYKLYQNRPNPFNPKTWIMYNIPEDVYVVLDILNINGRRVRILDEGFRKAGCYSIEFEGTDFSSGFYFYRFRAGPFYQVKRMLLLK
jgi:hypothetical protein